jgi:hypothetical protein
MAPNPGDPRRPGLRTQRLKFVWLLAVPFFFFALPTPGALMAGSGVALLGLALRALAAGTIEKDRTLAKGGIYGHFRHPLYVGSFLAGSGLALGGGRWWFLPTFMALFLLIYGRTIRGEERELEALFGGDYEEYRRGVPAFFPRVVPGLPSRHGKGFRFSLYLRNKEWEAALGVAGGFALLWIRMVVEGK